MQNVVRISRSLGVTGALLVLFCIVQTYWSKAGPAPSNWELAFFVAGWLAVATIALNFSLLALITFRRQGDWVTYGLAALPVFLVLSIFFLPPVYSSPI